MTGRERILATIRHRGTRPGADLSRSLGLAGFRIRRRQSDHPPEGLPGHGPDVHCSPGHTERTWTRTRMNLRPAGSFGRSDEIDGRRTHRDSTNLSDAGRHPLRSDPVPPAGGQIRRLTQSVPDRASVKVACTISPPFATCCRRSTADFDHLHRARKEVGDRGVIMVTINSPLDYHAGYARDMQDLMMDYYDDRGLFDDLFNLFQQRGLEQIRATLEGGAEFIFGTWFFNSLSSGWSPKSSRKSSSPRSGSRSSSPMSSADSTTTTMTANSSDSME